MICMFVMYLLLWKRQDSDKLGHISPYTQLSWTLELIYKLYQGSYRPWHDIRISPCVLSINSLYNDILIKTSLHIALVYNTKSVSGPIIIGFIFGPTCTNLYYISTTYRDLSSNDEIECIMQCKTSVLGIAWSAPCCSTWRMRDYSPRFLIRLKEIHWIRLPKY